MLEPLNYWRNVEVPATIEALDVKARDRVLDVGSPKIVSLYLWQRYGATVYATDLYDYFVKEYERYVRELRSINPSGRYVMETQHARRLTFPDGSFDKVFSISVLEHIEGVGDTDAIREIARVLGPGGRCVISVPIGVVHRELLTTKPAYYINVPAGQSAFYERHYDARTLRTRLIAPSGLDVAGIRYFAEGGAGYESWYEESPHWLQLALAPASAAASRLFLRELRNHPVDGRPAAAILTLVKKREPGLVEPGFEGPGPSSCSCNQAP